MSLVDNVSDAYDQADGDRVDAIAKTIAEHCYGLVLVDPDAKTMRSQARAGHPTAKKCVQLAAIFVNYIREELE